MENNTPQQETLFEDNSNFIKEAEKKALENAKNDSVKNIFADIPIEVAEEEAQSQAEPTKTETNTETGSGSEKAKETTEKVVKDFAKKVKAPKTFVNVIDVLTTKMCHLGVTVASGGDYKEELAEKFKLSESEKKDLETLTSSAMDELEIKLFNNPETMFYLALAVLIGGKFITAGMIGYSEYQAKERREQNAKKAEEIISKKDEQKEPEKYERKKFDIDENGYYTHGMRADGKIGYIPKDERKEKPTTEIKELIEKGLSNSEIYEIIKGGE